MKIVRRRPRIGVLHVWVEYGEIFISESLDKGRDVQTVCVTREELSKILANANIQEDLANGR